MHTLTAEKEETGETQPPGIPLPAGHDTATSRKPQSLRTRSKPSEIPEPKRSVVRWASV